MVGARISKNSEGGGVYWSEIKISKSVVFSVHF